MRQNTTAAAWRQFSRDGSTISHLRRVLAQQHRCPLCGSADAVFSKDGATCQDCAERLRLRRERRQQGRRGAGWFVLALSVLGWRHRKSTAALLVAALLFVGVSPAVAAPVQLDARGGFLPSALAVVAGRSGAAVLTVQGAAYTVQADPYGVTLTTVVGLDTVVSRVPWSGGDATVEVNGAAVVLSSATYPDPDVLDVLAGRLTDPAGFREGVLALQAVATPAVSPSSSSASDSCFWPCSSCALALLGYGLTISGLLGACAGTLGATCVSAVLYHFAASGSVVAICGECLVCLDQPSGGFDLPEAEPVDILRPGRGVHE